jgi:hypothetical protein
VEGGSERGYLSISAEALSRPSRPRRTVALRVRFCQSTDGNSSLVGRASARETELEMTNARVRAREDN